MNFASQETATDYEGIVHQLQPCHATAQEYRVSAHNYQQRIERNEATVGEMGSNLNPFSAATP